VVYNDEQFTAKDSDGIHNTSIGGKEGRADTIGEFGLGVLTMYHFTDVSCVSLSSLNVVSDVIAVGNGHFQFLCSFYEPLYETPASYKLFSFSSVVGACSTVGSYLEICSFTLIFHVRSYKDHLIALDGLFNFNMQADSYDGVSPHLFPFLVLSIF
jgi:hypothetical protein